MAGRQFSAAGVGVVERCLHVRLRPLCVQLHRHDLASEDRGDGPQRRAAPSGNHRGLPEGPGRLRQAVPSTAQLFEHTDIQ